MKPIYFYTVLVLIPLIFLRVVSFSQISEGGVPYSFQEDVNSQIKNAISSQDVIEIDVTETKKYIEDNYERLKDFYALYVDVDINVSSSGTWYNLENGDRIWIIKIRMADSPLMEPSFDDFFIPPGGKLFVYDESGEQILGAYTELNNNKYNSFTTQLIYGETIIFEYYESKNVKGKFRLHLNRLGYGIKKTR